MEEMNTGDRDFIIYTVKCEITGEIYVGATTDCLHQRKLDHQERAKRGENGMFQEAIATFGPEAFTWTQIDTANSNDELAQKEKAYVIQYDSKENGYNSDSGGGIKKTVYQYSIEDGSLLNTYDSLESAANAVSAAKTSIGNACLGQNKTCKGYIWSYSSTYPMNLKDERRKPVIQMDLQGNFITQYNSVSEAARQTGISKTCIARCCRVERDKSGGFKWKYV